MSSFLKGVFDYIVDIAVGSDEGSGVADAKMSQSPVSQSTPRPTQIAALPRLHKPTPAQFKAEFYKRELPCVITGIVSEWESFKCFDVDELKKRWGNLKVEADVSPNDFFPDSDSLRDANGTVAASMSFSEFLDIACPGSIPTTHNDTDASAARDTSHEATRPHLRKAYLQHKALEEFPGLKGMISVPTGFFRADVLQSENVWIGGGGHGGSATTTHMQTFSVSCGDGSGSSSCRPRTLSVCTP
eukprot:Opistho-2@22858